MLAVHMAAAGTVLAVPLWAPEAQAQVPAEQSRRYAIPAGPLTAALNRFAEDAGVLLSAPGELPQGKTSPGLSGEFTVAQGFAQLLAGSGLIAVNTGGNRYALQWVTADGAMTLDPVNVEGSATAQASPYEAARAEGSKSYTTTVTTVGKGATAIKDIPQSVSVVTRQMMDDRNITDLAQAMKQTTGMTVVRYDGAGIFNDIKSRGYSIEATQLDGVAMTQTTSFATSMDAAIYDRIEVLRGPTGLYQSGGEPGGTINLVRKRAQDQWHFGGLAGIGSWDAYRGEADVSGPLVESGKLRVRLVGVVDDRQSSQDVVETNKKVGYGTIEADLTEATTLSVGAARQEIDSVINQGLTGYADGRLLDVPRSTFFGADWNNQDTNTDEQFIELQHRLDNGGAAQISGRHVDRWMLYEGVRANSAVDPVSGNVNYESIINEDKQEEWTMDAHVSSPVRLAGLTHNVLVGADYRTLQKDLAYGYGATGSFNAFSPTHTFNIASIPYQYRNHTDTEQYGAYGQARIKAGVDWLTLVAGGRMSWWNTEVSNAMTGAVTARYSSRGEFTPYGGVVFDATDEVSVYASYTEIFKPQNAMDSSGNLIEPRVGGAYELGVKGAFLDDRLNTHLAVYQMTDENRAVAIPNCLGTNCNEAAGKVRSRGIEAQVTGSPLPHWDVSTGYAYVLTDTVKGTASTEGTTFSPETPKHTANLWAKYTIPNGDFEGLSLGGGARTVSSFYSQSNGIRWVQDGYTVFDAMAGYVIDKNFDLVLNVNNVFDKKYYEKMSSGRQFYYGESRNAMLTLRAKW